MDQFSHDLTLALEETSLMDRACGVGRWGSRRRTRSTGNLPCAPQPTEDSSSSPTDTLNAHGHGHGHHQHNSGACGNANVDGLDSNTHNTMLPASDSDEKAEAMLPLRLPAKLLNAAAAVRMGMGALESDSLNETTFSPARFYKPNSRRKRKIKRMSMEFEFSKDCNVMMVSPHSFTESPLQPGMLGTSGTATAAGGGGAGNVAGATAAGNVTGTVRKRVLKAECGANRSNLFFCGKRKRSNRDRYNEHEAGVVGHAGNCSGSSKLHSSSMPRYTHMEEFHRMRPRSYSSTSKPHSDRLLPLNKGLLSKINRIAQSQTQAQSQQSQKTDNTSSMEQGLDQARTTAEQLDANTDELHQHQQQLELRESHAETTETTGGGGDFSMEMLVPVSDIESLLNMPCKLPLENAGADYHAHRKKSHHRRRRFCQPTHPLHVQSMDCGELYDFSSSLSSSSDSEDSHRLHDTDREGDDELTDWPGNEFGPGGKYDPKRKLTKKSLLPQIRSDDTIGEDDTLMSGTEATAATTTAGASTFCDSYGISQSPTQPADAVQDLSRFQPAASSNPIEICGGGANRGNRSVGFMGVNIGLDMESTTNGLPAVRQIESEMSGETSNPFLSSSPPMQLQEVREIRAGCRRINGDRPGFSIKLSVNERLARFLQDPRQTQIRLPDIEIYEQDSLVNLSTLYSLNMVVENGCTVLTKTRNTTQSVNVDPQRNLQQRQDLIGDFKRRCYGGGNVDNDASTATATAPAAVPVDDTAAEQLPNK
ncbi:uncharacterized protein LOC133849210 [Drosophila sulfurigaster albostrigata]|uniref:uncharacterized protein LOC133849210 n=1 Tax=Drosophila sulfurigaster albostrigata TaxID=89887 RepID=UPI002D21E77B|nr:uncharacterized protein LOC133849210 [Drosophila sulfurigaster albostrigata]